MLHAGVPYSCMKYSGKRKMSRCLFWWWFIFLSFSGGYWNTMDNCTHRCILYNLPLFWNYWLNGGWESSKLLVYLLLTAFKVCKLAHLICCLITTTAAGGTVLQRTKERLKKLPLVDKVGNYLPSIGAVCVAVCQYIQLFSMLPLCMSCIAWYCDWTPLGVLILS